MDVHDIISRIDYDLMVGAPTPEAACRAVGLIQRRCDDLLDLLDLYGLDRAAELISSSPGWRSERRLTEQYHRLSDQLDLDLEGAS